MSNSVEVLVDEDLPVETLRLPRALVLRIAGIVEEEALGYRSFGDFLLAALRSELKRAEKTSYFLKEGPR